jgi:hypothetical protein
VNRIIDYDPPENEEEVVHRTLAMVHYKLDEVFSSRGSDQNRRSHKRQFSMVGEDTIIDGTRLEAGEEPGEPERLNKGLPPPPVIKQQEQLPPQFAQASAVAPPPAPEQTPATARRGDIRKDARTSKSAKTRKRVITAPSSPMSNAPTSLESASDASVPQPSRSWSFKLFIFLFAVFIGSVSGAIFYLLKIQ